MLDIDSCYSKAIVTDKTRVWTRMHLNYVRTMLYVIDLAICGQKKGFPMTCFKLQAFPILVFFSLHIHKLLKERC